MFEINSELVKRLGGKTFNPCDVIWRKESDPRGQASDVDDHIFHLIPVSNIWISDLSILFRK